jgi:hypothetical protein
MPNFVDFSCSLDATVPEEAGFLRMLHVASSSREPLLVLSRLRDVIGRLFLVRLSHRQRLALRHVRIAPMFLRQSLGLRQLRICDTLILSHRAMLTGFQNNSAGPLTGAHISEAAPRHPQAMIIWILQMHFSGGLVRPYIAAVRLFQSTGKIQHIGQEVRRQRSQPGVLFLLPHVGADVVVLETTDCTCIYLYTFYLHVQIFTILLSRLVSLTEC